jgi:hypothetical protein
MSVPTVDERPACGDCFREACYRAVTMPGRGAGRFGGEVPCPAPSRAPGLGGVALRPLGGGRLSRSAPPGDRAAASQRARLGIARSTLGITPDQPGSRDHPASRGDRRRRGGMLVGLGSSNNSVAKGENSMSAMAGCVRTSSDVGRSRPWYADSCLVCTSASDLKLAGSDTAGRYAGVPLREGRSLLPGLDTGSPRRAAGTDLAQEMIYNHRRGG